ncbi:tyrosine-type recombinase/integrase [Staphylococcus hyicus]|uniref:tyrosine-type recombinase/integrase n=1 Tax=Staphylococcus hyicus TaxID=1284 RepID=UPI00057DCD6E|nr:site-specific integrase [Staphylococcus hyicus]MCQ9301344.1 tyrosine-type recombinase/integrase [Staphylococcus hyicus]MDP4468724.1 site-specific integrase [Staphylococcus hyicus]RTX68882.1 site-specific integrase [Staphylococcus hyicus]
MLRERAKKLPDITDELWEKVDPVYKELVEEYLTSVDLSTQSKKQYRSALRQFGFFLYDSLNNKPLYKIKKRDAMRYVNFLREHRKMSSSGINLKKSAISAFCQWIENYIADDYEDENGVLVFETFRNFMKGLPPVVKNQVYQKIKITYDEYRTMMEALEDDENYLGMAWLAVAFNVGARRAEIIQFKTEIVDYEFNDEGGYVLSHNLRGKGRGEDGKVLQYMINEEALLYLNLWLDKRGYDSEYIFTVGNEKRNRLMGITWADYFCENVLSPILGRRINPHIFKASCITYLLEEKGLDIKLVSKYIAHHESVETTQIYDLRDFEDERKKIFT